MIPTPFRRRFCVCLLLCVAALCAHAEPRRTVRTHDEAPEAIDTAVVMDNVQVTAIKQGLTLRNRPVAASVVGRETIERRGVTAIKELSQLVPNFHIPDYGSRMTSSVYVRGLGARIDQPVMGLNVDNVPYLSKDDYDFDLADIERIEVLRGPQSTLYGRNTMGGVMNIYTLSPLAYEGTRLGAEYASGNTLRLRASTYHRPSPRTGVSLAARFMHGDGFFTNEYTGRTCDWERSGGARMRLQFRPDERWSIDNTLAFGMLRQGGYPYASAATGRIAYNDPCGYHRTTLNDGLTIRYAADGWEIASITSYQYSDDRMTLDQDFLPDSYFTLTQAKQDHGLTEDIVVRSRGEGRYGWLVGAFGFYRHRSMQAPVLFKEDGLERLIADKAEQYTGLRPHFASDRMALDSDFRNPAWGAALYHESQLRLGRFDLSAGLRIDYERTRLRYLSSTDIDCTFGDGRITPFTERGTLHKSFVQLLPKAAAVYRIDDGNSLYASVAKGYKAGGFNTQMFSEVLQNSVMERMGVYWDRHYDIDRVVAYKPEKSWNFEVGSHFAFADGRIRGEATLFYILPRPAAHRLSRRADHRTHDDQRRPHPQPRRRTLGAGARRTPARPAAELRLHPRHLRRIPQRKRRLRRQADSLRTAPYGGCCGGVHGFRRPQLARRNRPERRRPGRRADRMERSQLAAAEILCAGRLRDPVRTTARLAEPLVPQPHADTLRRLLFRVDRQRLPATRPAARMGRHTDNQFTT